MSEKYKALHMKARKLTVKLKAVLEEKKKLRRGVKGREARLAGLLKENERIERNTTSSARRPRRSWSCTRRGWASTSWTGTGWRGRTACWRRGMGCWEKERERHEYRGKHEKERRRVLLDRAKVETGHARRECEAVLHDVEEEEEEEDVDLRLGVGVSGSK